MVSVGIKIDGIAEAIQMLGSVNAKYEGLQKMFAKGLAVSVKTINNVAMDGGFGQGVKRFGRDLEDRFQGFNNLGQAAQNLAGELNPAVNKAIIFDEAMADMRKTTGLTAIEAENLSASLSSIDTRTLQNSLLGIAEIGGQLNVPKQELEGFVQSIDKATVALSKDFGGSAERVATELGTIKDLFKETKGLDYGSAMLKIGSSLNALGDAGAATADSVSMFTTRMGQLGKLAPGLKENLAFGAVFQEAGISAEISSGGLTNLLKVAGQNSEKFAKTLGLTGEEFGKLFNNDKAGFVLKFAEGLQGMDDIKLSNLLKDLGLGDQETLKVLSSLSENTEKFADKLKIVNSQFKDANSIQKEYDVKNNTIGANAEKFAKILDGVAVSIGKSVAPYMPLINVGASLTTTFSALIPMLPLIGSAFSAMLGPVGLIVLGIAAIAGTFYYLYYNSSLVNDVLDNLFGSVAEQAALLGTQLSKIIATSSAMKGSFSFFSLLEGVFAGLGIYLRIFFDLMFLELNLALTWIRFYIIEPFAFFVSLIQTIGMVFSKVFAGDFEAALGIAFGFVQRFIDRMTSLFTDAFAGIATGFYDIADTVGSALGFESNKPKEGKEQAGVGSSVFDIFNKGLKGELKKDAGIGDSKDLFKDKGAGLNTDLDTQKSITKGLDGVSGGGQKNITINVPKLIENLILNNQNFTENLAQAEKDIYDALFRVLEGANQVS